MTADDAFAAGCEDGAQVPLDDATARAIARNVGSDLKKQRENEEEEGGTDAA